MTITKMAKTALLQRFTGVYDKNGYTRSPKENLLPNIDLAKVEGDLRRGDGDELRIKFCAVHSSAALAVNCFAPFKERPGEISILGQLGATQVEFEKKLIIFDGRKGPNMDVWIDRKKDVVAVESKLLEYLTPKRAEFSSAYDRLAPPVCDPCWWHAFKEAKQGTLQYLDRAQLLKHYFGLNKLWKNSSESRPVTLLYLFWEPLNWAEIKECRQHRHELQTFAGAVSDSQIAFRWTTYNLLWDGWVTIPQLENHARNLMTRYQVRL